MSKCKCNELIWETVITYPVNLNKPKEVRKGTTADRIKIGAQSIICTKCGHKESVDKIIETFFGIVKDKV